MFGGFIPLSLQMKHPPKMLVNFHNSRLKVQRHSEVGDGFIDVALLD
jgi:hypothetical protein